MDVRQFWRDILAQDAAAIRGWFCDDACIRWHCTNEDFSVEEFIRANCDYPGDWDGEVERVETLEGGCITVTRVFPKDRSAFFHVTSFLTLKEGRIAAMDEYWADDGPPPLWRQEMKIGRPIR